ncbi:dihydroorotase [Syntrophobacter fumaroxidans]|uniref:Allantoinase n=1 Tax=Syntrophobacter fumaroxidans (strain DSM 10017 / MPOB) TaxID=335543 RepID=A0LK75_SYNFM|nr:amidohydrolase family protein [Syntrophobacter fumaroxidans]ABK17827.1 Allantoinase [Syntrophobacter fumaroxidans MPOB]
MNSIDLIVRGGTIYAADGHYRADIAVKDERIVAIGHAELFPRARTEVDATGLCVLPGLWHTHCHFREPGHTDKEDFTSGTRAAAAGGITFCIDMTNNTPHPSTLEDFQMKLGIAREKACVDFGLYGAGLYPDQIGKLAGAGAIGIKVFNTRHIKEVYPYISELGVLNHGLLYEIYEAVADTGLICSVHHDDPDWCRRMTFREYINVGKTENRHYMEAYEKGYMYGHGMVAGLAASLYYADLAGVSLYVLHLGVMPPGAYEMIRHAKVELGQEVYAELEISTALMTRKQAEKVGPCTYVWAYSPETAWDSLESGVTDVIVGEHAPHTVAEMEPGWKDNFSVPLGITGAQEFIPLMLTQVNNGTLRLEDLVWYCSESPARIFGVYPRKGTISIDADADFTIVDMNRRKILTGADMYTKSRTTSWEGMEVTGMPVYTIVRGEVVMRDGQILAQPGFGRFLPGKAASGA